LWKIGGRHQKRQSHDLVKNNARPNLLVTFVSVLYANFSLIICSLVGAFASALKYEGIIFSNRIENESLLQHPNYIAPRISNAGFDMIYKGCVLAKRC